MKHPCKPHFEFWGPQAELITQNYEILTKNIDALIISILCSTL